MRRTLLLPALAFLLLPACDDGHAPARMLHLDPPPTWAADLQRARQAKDESFLRDPESPLLAGNRATFAGLEYFEPDPGLYYVGQVVPYEQPKQFTIITTNGDERPCERAGRVTFEVDGEPQTLQVYRLLDQTRSPDDPGYFLPFTDATSGDETYPAGRYVELEGPPQGPFVLDFNRAYNPYCAYGAPERYACPVTPGENRLDVAIRAGERGYVQHDG